MTSNSEAPHVVVDVRLAHAAGHRTYIRNIVPRLAQHLSSWRWTLLGNAAFLEAQTWAHAENVAVVDCKAQVYSVREQFEIPLRVPRDADLFWATHYNVPLLLRMPVVVTVHDLAHLRLPEYTSNVLRRAYARSMISAAMARASAVMCDSDFTRRELLALVRPPRKEPTVVHLGVDSAWYDPGDWRDRDASLTVGWPYFVFVGNLKPHKNLRTLLAAFRSLEDRLPHRLVIIGKMDQLRTPDTAIHDDIRAMGQRVVLAGEVSDERLRALVRGATALILPSLYEGFGFPPLEAMAASCPAIVSRCGSLPEVCGDAALYCDSQKPADFATAMLALATEPGSRSELVAKGRARARLFAWEVCAVRTADVLMHAWRR